MAQKITLAYWKIRGLGQAVRLLLGYTGTDFVDKLYVMGEAPDFDRSDWLNEKEKLGLDFPNLPYLIDGDIKITQSNAVLRYVGRKHNLDGNTEQEKVYVDIMENMAMDFRNSFVGFCYGVKAEEVDKKRQPFIDGVRERFLKRFEAFLTNKEYFAGSNLTYPDFHMWELLQQHLVFEPTILEGFPNLQAFCKRFETIPKIAAFLKSEKCFKGPMNNPVALIR